MIQRLSVNLLLKSVILTLSAAIVVVLSIGAWNSWQRQAALRQIASVVETSSYFFTALHNLRVDRSTTSRELGSDRTHSTPTEQFRILREAEVPALKAGLASLAKVDFPGRDAAMEKVDRATKKLEALQQQAVTAMAQPKASRRPGLAKEYFDETDGMVRMIDAIASDLTRRVKLDDAYIDQLLQIKQLAWTARNHAGDLSVLISNMLGGLPKPADPLMLYTASASKVDTAWATLEEVAAGLALPEQFHKAVANAKREFLSADFVELRIKTLKA